MEFQSLSYSFPCLASYYIVFANLLLQSSLLATLLEVGVDTVACTPDHDGLLLCAYVGSWILSYVKVGRTECLDQVKFAILLLLLGSYSQHFIFWYHALESK
jgi:hypothetical protein